MITIDQLLESVDLNFEPRFVTKDESGEICIWDDFKPYPDEEIWNNTVQSNDKCFGELKLVEFANKPWQECIYEVPRKTTEKIKEIILTSATTKNTDMFIVNKINELVDAVNKHADIIQQIGEWGTRKGECLWCENLTKFEPEGLKGVKNE